MEMEMLSNSKFADTHVEERRRAAPSGVTDRPKNTVAFYLSPADVVLDFDAANKAQVFAEVAKRIEHRHGVARRTVYEALCEREGFHSTALGRGVAIPHARVGGLQNAVAMFVRARHPIAFDAPDGKPVAHMLVLLVPEAAIEQHLQILAETSRLFCDRRFREQLADATDADAVCRLFADGPRG
jgi:PTS system nitrogen regulatory IIA component